MPALRAWHKGDERHPAVPRNEEEGSDAGRSMPSSGEVRQPAHGWRLDRVY